MIFFVFLLLGILSLRAQLPIIAIPGIDDSCGNSVFSILAENVQNPVHCMDPSPDYGTWYTSSTKQIEKVCDYLDSNVVALNLTGGFYLFGVSQGGLWARVALEKCDAGKFVKRLFTFGGPHMGVARIPETGRSWVSKALNSFAGLIVYIDWVQDIVGPAGYYHDLSREEEYMKSIAVLPDYNNQRSSANSTQYKERIEQLEQFVMVKFSQDIVVIPKESAHFGYFADSSQNATLNYTQVPEYKDLGLDELDKRNALYFYAFDAPHADISLENLEKFIFPHFK